VTVETLVFDEHLDFLLGNYDVDGFRILVYAKDSGEVVGNRLISVKMRWFGLDGESV
jgi:hypothetical protein